MPGTQGSVNRGHLEKPDEVLSDGDLTMSLNFAGTETSADLRLSVFCVALGIK